jgi:hypothetical protein
MGATSFCRSSAVRGAPCPEYPLSAGGGGACAGSWPWAAKGTTLMTSRKDSVADKSCFRKFLIIFFTPSRKGFEIRLCSPIERGPKSHAAAEHLIIPRSHSQHAPVTSVSRTLGHLRSGSVGILVRCAANVCPQTERGQEKIRTSVRGSQKASFGYCECAVTAGALRRSL